MIEPVDPDYTQGDGQFCPHSPLHSLHNNSLLSRRKEERRERGGNCAERKATADPSVRLNALEAQRGREQCLILRGVGLVLDLFFLSFFGQ